MTESAVAIRDDQPDGREAALLEQAAIVGDLAQLQPRDRVTYYQGVCRSLGLNPLTKPFQYITLNGKLTLYATRTAADQLRALKGVSIDNIEHAEAEGLYIVTVYGHDAKGRTDSEVGAVPIAGLKGEARANAVLKAVTKAKRRLTLSLAGLGWLDETEVAAVPSAQATDVDMETGEITARRSLRDQVAARRDEVITSGRTHGAAPVGPDAEAVVAQGSDDPPHPAESVGDGALGRVPSPGQDASGDASRDGSAGARTDTQGTPGSASAGNPEPAHDGSEATPLASEPSPDMPEPPAGATDRCEAFSADHGGRCTRAPGHAGHHYASDGTWAEATTK